MSHTFQAPTACAKCGGAMEEGFAVDNEKFLDPPHPAFGERISLGGSESWWKLSKPKNDKDGTVGLLGKGLKAEKVIYQTEGFQIFTYRCQVCGYLEAYAPKRG